MLPPIELWPSVRDCLLERAKTKVLRLGFPALVSTRGSPPWLRMAASKTMTESLRRWLGYPKVQVPNNPTSYSAFRYTQNTDKNGVHDCPIAPDGER